MRMHRLYLAPVMLYLLMLGCSDDIPPYDESLTWEQLVEPVSGDSTKRMQVIKITVNNEIFAIKDEKLWYSTNQGDDWQLIESPIGFLYYRTYLIHNDGVIFINDENILYRTTNYGASWTQHTLPINGYMLLHPSGHVFLGAYFAFYRSTDLGTSWHTVDVPRDKNNYSPLISIARNGDLLINGCPKIYYSLNEGTTWDSMPVQPTSTQMFGFHQIFAYSISNIIGINIIPSQVTYRSVDLGQTWENLNFPFPVSDVLWSDGIPRLMSGSKGVYRLCKNGSWSQVNIGLPDMPYCNEYWCFVTKLLMDSTGFVYASTSANGSFRSQQPLGEFK